MSDEGIVFGGPRCFTGHLAPIRALSFAPDGHHAASGARDGTVILWNLDTGRALVQLERNLGFGVNALAFTPDGSRLLSAGGGCAMSRWNLVTGRRIGHALAASPASASEVLAVACSPDGRLALTGGEDASVRLWDIDSGKKLRSFGGWLSEKHHGKVASVAFSPDGRRALSGGEDNTIRLWDVAGGKQLRHVNTPMPIATVGFLDGDRAFAVDWDGVVRQWDSALESERNSLKSNQGRSHTIRYAA